MYFSIVLVLQNKKFNKYMYNLNIDFNTINCDELGRFIINLGKL